LPPGFGAASIVEHKIIIFAFEPRLDAEVLADLSQNQFRHLRNQNANIPGSSTSIAKANESCGSISVINKRC